MGKWIYRVGLSKDEASEEALKKSGLKYEEVEVEPALRAHISEVLDRPYKLQTSMREDAPEFFSCSSLVSYLYIFAGLWIPSLSWEKYDFAKKIKRDDLRFGDLVFSHHGRLTDKPVDHVGMYLGEGKVLHAAGQTYGGKVMIEELEESLAFANARYGRVIDDLKERRYVVEVPDDRIDLRSKENLIKEINKYA